MNAPERIQHIDGTTASLQIRQRQGARTRSETKSAFHDQFVALFDAHFQRVYRYLARLSGEAELAADLAQETFIKLYRRGSVPDRPEAWLITVALNLFRNARSSRLRRQRLLTLSRAEGAHADPLPAPGQAADSEDLRGRVRRAIEQLPERERNMLLLRTEGYSYHDIAAALSLNEASVGTLLARARNAFQRAYKDASDAP